MTESESLAEYKKYFMPYTGPTTRGGYLRKVVDTAKRRCGRTGRFYKMPKRQLMAVSARHGN